MEERKEMSNSAYKTTDCDKISTDFRANETSGGDNSLKRDCEGKVDEEKYKRKRRGHVEELVDSNAEIPELETLESCDSVAKMNSSKTEKEKQFDESAFSQSSIIFVASRPIRLQRFNPITKCLTEMHDFNDEMKGSIFNYSSISFGDYIYVSMTRSFYRLKYRDAEAKWERMADLITDHGTKPPAAVVANAIYVAGSRNGAETRSTAKYDPSLNRWEQLKDKELKTSWSAVISSQGYVYCIGGGAKGIGVTDRVERINVVSQTWEEVEPMREDRRCCSGADCDGKIFIAGGVDTRFRILHSVEKYDPEVNQWTLMKPMIVARRYFRCHSIDGVFYAIFGERNSKNEPPIEKYDIENDEWEVVEFPKIDVRSTESAIVKF